MKKLLDDLSKKVDIGLVGGSDLTKISDQMNSGPDCKLIDSSAFFLIV